MKEIEPLAASIFGPDYVVMSNVEHHELLVRIQMAEQKMRRRCVNLCEQVAELCRTDAKLSCYAEAIDLMIEELRKVEPECASYPPLLVH